METAAAGSPLAITTVAGSARSCSESFQKCLNKAAQIHHRELSLVEDQHARFAIWAANIRVFSAGRDSLDHRLREAPDVQDAVIGLLQALDYRIQSCSNILEPIAEKTTGTVLEKISQDLDQAIEAISKELTLLHKISNTIRRASKEKQNIQAEKSFKIQDEEGNDAEPFLRQLFSNQIRDRFPGASDNIQQRLANSMVLRRKRILYRRKRYDKKPIRPPQLPLPPTVSTPNVKPNVGVQRKPVEQQTAPAPTPSIVPSVPQTATTLVAEKFQQAAAPSVISVSKTVALSSHDQLQFPPAPCGALMKRYRRFKKKQEEQLKVILEAIPGYYGPKAPPAPGARDAVRKHRISHRQTLDDYWDECLRAVGEVVCQFCFYALPVRDVIQESKWRLHVKNDLDPYVCLFEECDSPEHLYNHSDVWLRHMKQHALRWRCTSKSHPTVVCNTKDEYINHMKTSHGGKFNDAQLGVLADRSGRAVGPLFTSCPLCGVEDVKGGMEEHVVGHMRFLALKSLPATKEDQLDDESGTDDSAAASKPHSRSTIDNDRERYTPFDPDDLFHLLNSNRQHDESIDFVDEAVFADVPDDQWRLFEWGFIPSSHGTALDYKSDPIVVTFLYASAGLVLTGEFNPSGWPTFRADPDCAICQAPASMECDCEARAVDVAVKQQEHRIFEPMRKRARDWARRKAQNFITNEFKTYVESQDFKTYVESGLPASEGQDTASALSRQETNEAWAANVLRYPKTIEHFFSLVDYTLPADDAPEMTDPKPRPPHSIFPRPPHSPSPRPEQPSRSWNSKKRPRETKTPRDLYLETVLSPGSRSPSPRSTRFSSSQARVIENDSADMGSEEYFRPVFDDDDNGKANEDDEYDEEMKVPPPRSSNSSAPRQRTPGEGGRPSPPRRPHRYVSYVEDAEEDSDVSDSILTNTGSKRAYSPRYTSDGEYPTAHAPNTSVPIPTFGEKRGHPYAMEDIQSKTYLPKDFGRKQHTVVDFQYWTYNINSEETKPHPPHDSALDPPNNDGFPRPLSPDCPDGNQEKIKEKIDN
ncbi:hypothetical protein LCI18_007955 [Fusarium solani-melongenae]|uniref:Uncharacterized protein n=1 Tax=Fusarium solani subsp. cucurbitae TaxID=2747967 RepID=A0ACD3Z723_FUSSC|nr:hypothetical protein LCI18_007955 [Fusarium solani-melongenae]